MVTSAPVRPRGRVMIAMFPRYPGGSPARLGPQHLVSSLMAQMAAGSTRCTVEPPLTGGQLRVPVFEEGPEHRHRLVRQRYVCTGQLHAGPEAHHHQIVQAI